MGFPLVSCVVNAGTVWGDFRDLSGPEHRAHPVPFSLTESYPQLEFHWLMVELRLPSPASQIKWYIPPFSTKSRQNSGLSGVTLNRRQPGARQIPWPGIAYRPCDMLFPHMISDLMQFSICVLCDQIGGYET